MNLRPAADHGRSSLRVGATTALAVAGLIAGGIGLGAAPAQAAPAPAVDNAVFSWTVSEETGGGAYFGGCNFLTAGIVGDVHSSHVWSDEEGAAYYTTSEGDVTITRPDASGQQVAPTWPTRCIGADGSKVTPWAGSTTNTQVNLAHGVGTLDPATDTASLAWNGGFSIVFYGGMTYWSIADVKLEMTNGVGHVTGTASGYGADMNDTKKWVQLAPRTIELATFRGADLTDTGAIVQTDYAGVAITTKVAEQVRTNPGWGSFPQSWVDFNNETGQSSYWYSSGGNSDPKKPAKPFALAYTVPAPTTEPQPGTGADDGDVEVTIPETEPTTPPATGEFGWAWESSEAMKLGTAEQQGATFVASGEMNRVVVTDTRAGGTGPYAWTVSGQASDFVAADGSTFAGSSLGWSPRLESGTPARVSAGAEVVPSLLGGAGLSAPAVLGTATAATSATLGAGLSLAVPSTTKAGDYRAKVTITAIS